MLLYGEAKKAIRKNAIKEFSETVATVIFCVNISLFAQIFFIIDEVYLKSLMSPKKNFLLKGKNYVFE